MSKRSEVERLVRMAGNRLLSYDDKALRAYIRAAERMHKVLVGPELTPEWLEAATAYERAKVRLLEEEKRG